MPATVLIASADQLAALRMRHDLSDAVTFLDTDALRALDLITRQRPDVVAVDHAFAVTTRGAALINRIKADPSLVGCEIRVVVRDNGVVPAAPAGTSPEGYLAPDTWTGATDAAARPGSSRAALSQTPAETAGRRRAPRTRFAAGVHVSIDGNLATVVDMSVLGAQVLSPAILRPNQRIRVTAPGGSALRATGTVVWVSLEIPDGGARYRAGIEFVDANQGVLAAFIEAHKG